MKIFFLLILASAGPLIKPEQDSAPIITPPATLLEISKAAPSQKPHSIMVTAKMRENAARNVERFAWAKAEKKKLLARIAPYENVSDEFLWNLLPSQGMPRSSYMEKTNSPPPGSEDSHFGVSSAASRGFGRKSHYFIDPFNHPWKVQSRGSKIWYPDNDFEAYYKSALDAQGNFTLGKGNPELLTAKSSSHASPLIDDGTGAEFNGKKFFFAAHYAYAIWSELLDVVETYAKLYTLTNNPSYAHKAGVLLDRMADLYPQMDYTPWFKMGMEASTGGSGLGRVQGQIWETFTVQKLATAYDQIFDALIEDTELQKFSQKMAEKFHLGDKSSGRQIAGHIEEHLLREFVKGIHDSRIRGNPGMVQNAMATTAIALDNGEETTELLDWLFEPDGGKFPEILVDGLSRDGFGHEGGLGYASIPTRTSFTTAKLLMDYPRYQRNNLFQEFPKLRNALTAGQNVTVSNGAILHWGDGGKAMRISEFGYPMPIEMAFLGFQLSNGEPKSVRELFNSSHGSADKIPGNIYAEDPEQERQVAAQAIKELPPIIPQSFNSGGIGFAVLQAPSRENARMVALNYGPMGWGHGNQDRLGLHLIDRDAYMATDLGYPTLTGAYPPRIGWTSHTVSHNTVMVNDKGMNTRSTFSGKARLFVDAGPVRIMDIDSAGRRVMQGKEHFRLQEGRKFVPTISTPHPLYPDVTTYRRCVVMVDVDPMNSYYIDLFWVRGGKSHRLIQNGGGHMVTSNLQTWKKQAKGTAAGEDVAFGEFYDGPSNWDYRGSGLMFLQNVERTFSPEPSFWVEWQIAPPYNNAKDLRFRVHTLSPVDEALLADGEAPSRGPILRYLHRTIKGENLKTQFVSVLEPYEKSPFIQSTRVLGTSHDANQFAVALEVTLTDGRKDILLVTENGEPFESAGWGIQGRAAWARLHPDGALAETTLIEASHFKTPNDTHTLEPTSYRGVITNINDADSQNVLLKTDLENPPNSLVGKTIIIANQQRADASYPIIGITKSGELNIGPAALAEHHVDLKDYSKGIIRNIAINDPFSIANSHYQKTSSSSED